jgi:hypothetical protein
MTICHIHTKAQPGFCNSELYTSRARLSYYARSVDDAAPRRARDRQSADTKSKCPTCATSVSYQLGHERNSCREFLPAPRSSISAGRHRAIRATAAVRTALMNGLGEPAVGCGRAVPQRIKSSLAAISRPADSTGQVVFICNSVPFMGRWNLRRPLHPRRARSQC